MGGRTRANDGLSARNPGKVATNRRRGGHTGDSELRERAASTVMATGRARRQSAGRQSPTPGQGETLVADLQTFPSSSGDPGAPPDDTRAAAWDRRKWYILAAICVAQFMVVLDVAVVNVALPSIRSDLHFSVESLQWVLSAYAIFFGGFLLLGGRLADVLGRRRLFMIGLVLFSGASLACGLSWNRGLAHHLPLHPGARRGAALAGRPVDPRHHLRRGPRAQPRTGHLGRHRRQRRRGRHAARRRADERLRLAVDLLRERADRRRPHRLEPLPVAGEPRRGAAIAAASTFPAPSPSPPASWCSSTA